MKASLHYGFAARSTAVRTPEQLESNFYHSQGYRDIINSLIKDKALKEETTSQSFKKGDLVEVTKCIIGHKFEIGEIVTVIQGEGDIWLCSNDNGVKWYLKDDEGIVITREEATRIKNWNQFSLTDEYKNCPSKDLLMRYYVFWLKDNFNPPTPKK